MTRQLVIQDAPLIPSFRPLSSEEVLLVSGSQGWEDIEVTLTVPGPGGSTVQVSGDLGQIVDGAGDLYDAAVYYTSIGIEMSVYGYNQSVYYTTNFFEWVANTFGGGSGS